MKQFLLLFVLVSFVMAHDAHGVDDVTSSESLLWMKMELNLSNDLYKTLSAKIRSYKKAGYERTIRALQDSIETEQKKTTPIRPKISHWSSDISEIRSRKNGAFAAHLKEIQDLLPHDIYVKYENLIDKIYIPSMKDEKPTVHEHAHTHDVDAITHAHQHLHNSEDSAHGHSHQGLGKSHTHTHSH